MRLGGDWRSRCCTSRATRFGHLAIWDPRSRAAIIIDAVLERGIYSRDGELLIPPRIYDADAYRRSDPRLLERSSRTCS